MLHLEIVSRKCSEPALPITWRVFTPTGNAMRLFARKFHFCLFLSVISCAQTSENKELVPATSAMAALETALMELDADSAMRYGSLALCIRNVKTGQTLLAHNPRRAMVIASNMKLVTTLTALEILGQDFRFKTELQHDGELRADGTLTGNLYIKGGGDPTLGSDRTEGSPDTGKLMDLWTAGSGRRASGASAAAWLPTTVFSMPMCCPTAGLGATLATTTARQLSG